MSFFPVATMPPRLPNQKRGTFYCDFNFAANLFIVLLRARPRFAIKMNRRKRRGNIELAKICAELLVRAPFVQLGVNRTRMIYLLLEPPLPPNRPKPLGHAFCL
jgi:hypothetical protein